MSSSYVPHVRLFVTLSISSAKRIILGRRQFGFLSKISWYSMECSLVMNISKRQNVFIGECTVDDYRPRQETIACILVILNDQLPYLIYCVQNPGKLFIIKTIKSPTPHASVFFTLNNLHCWRLVSSYMFYMYKLLFESTPSTRINAQSLQAQNMINYNLRKITCIMIRSGNIYNMWGEKREETMKKKQEKTPTLAISLKQAWTQYPNPRNVIPVNGAMCLNMLPPDLVWVELPRGSPWPPNRGHGTTLWCWAGSHSRCTWLSRVETGQ